MPKCANIRRNLNANSRKRQQHKETKKKWQFCWSNASPMRTKNWKHLLQSFKNYKHAVKMRVGYRPNEKGMANTTSETGCSGCDSGFVQSAVANARYKRRSQCDTNVNNYFYIVKTIGQPQRGLTKLSFTKTL